MKSHVTPVLTPPVVRVLGSVLIGAAGAVLTTTLPRGIQAAVLVVAVAAACLLTFSHPYRARMREWAERQGVAYRLRLEQAIPLFPLWLAFMLLPLFTMPVWGSVLVFLLMAGFTFLCYPHLDGTRVLAWVKPGD